MYVGESMVKFVAGDLGVRTGMKNFEQDGRTEVARLYTVCMVCAITHSDRTSSLSYSCCLVRGFQVFET